MKTSIFVSKSVDVQSSLVKFCKLNNWELIDRSLIYFENVQFIVRKEFDIVFISSIRSFEYFLEGYHGDPENLNYAVAGKSTAAQMNVQNSQIKYIVEKSGDTAQSSTEFIEWLGERRVLFPVSQISNNSYSRLVKEDQKEVIICYNTLSYPSEIDECEIYVFTSPSNVQSFLLKNTIPRRAKVIAWGNTTEAYLLRKNIKPAFILKESSEEELVEYLSELISA